MPPPQFNFAGTEVDKLALDETVADDTRASTRRAAPSARIPADLSFATSPALRRQVAGQVIARATREDPVFGRAMGTSIGTQDYNARFADVVKGTGLNPANLVDVMTAQLAMQWMAANDTTTRPGPAAYRGLARQVGANIGRVPGIADLARRARLGEEMKVSTVMIRNGWLAARREGKQAEFSRRVLAEARQKGLVLTAVDLTDKGFVPRK